MSKQQHVGTTVNLGRVSEQQQQGSNAKKQGPTTLHKVGEGMKHAGNVLNGVKGVLDIIDLVKNHPTWYTHYDTSSLVNMNLATKQSVDYPQTLAALTNASNSIRGGYAMPSVASMRILLTTPCDDMEGWRTGIRLLWQQIRTANAGRINCDQYDMEKYVLTVRLLHAVSAYLTRLYEMTYTFRSTNSQLPRLLVEACGVNFDDIMSNAADLFMYIQRFNQRIEKFFPLKIDLFSRARWLFGNVFIDSTSSKPSFYVTDFAHYRTRDNTGCMAAAFYYTSDSTAVGDVAWKQSKWPAEDVVTYMTYEDLFTQCEALISACVSSQRLSIIAADIIKAFGDSAFYAIPSPAINAGIVAVYDDNVLSQLQNARVATQHHVNETTSSSWGVYGNSYSQSLASSLLFYEEENLASEFVTSYMNSTLVPAGLTGAMTEATLTLFNNRADNYMVNWHADKIDAGHILSITRFATAWGTVQTSSSTDFEIGSFGTEVMVGVYALVIDNLTNATGFAPIAGLIANANSSTIPQLSALWANFDWTPRMSFMSATTVNGTYVVTMISSEMLDWDVFAMVNAEAQRTYFSYGDQSLLYAGSSQNQSNGSVYMKGTGKTAKPTKSGKKPETKVLTADKK